MNFYFGQHSVAAPTAGRIFIADAGLSHWYLRLLPGLRIACPPRLFPRLYQYSALPAARRLVERIHFNGSASGGKPRIAFIANNVLRIGGVETRLCNYLKYLSDFSTVR